MTTTAAVHDAVDDFDRVHLEKLRLAATVIVELGEGNVINSALESELYLFRDRVDRAMLLPAASASSAAEGDRDGDGPLPAC